ncbi:MAG: MgtC/SapB family protein [Gemmataceae bacterium]|nr:MgtC/SapB family protein [Gemmataceae bacterium]
MTSWIEGFWEGLSNDLFVPPDGRQIGQIVGRTVMAAILGGLLGYEREQKGKAAGMRTHMLVALAAAFFVIVPQQMGSDHAAVSRVVQGLAAGVGFLGAGAIMKQTDKGQVLGLTTAAGLYFTTAIGIAAGLGQEITALLATLLSLLIIRLLPYVEGILPLPKRGLDADPEPKSVSNPHEVIDVKKQVDDGGLN